MYRSRDTSSVLAGTHTRRFPVHEERASVYYPLDLHRECKSNALQFIGAFVPWLWGYGGVKHTPEAVMNYPGDCVLLEIIP